MLKLVARYAEKRADFEKSYKLQTDDPAEAYEADKKVAEHSPQC